MYRELSHRELVNQHARIGRYESTLEDGTLHLYCHEFGRANGFSTRMTKEETLQLLEWLERNREAIRRATREGVETDGFSAYRS